MSSNTERGKAAREEALAPINHQLPTEVQFTDLQGKDPEHTTYLSVLCFTRTGELGREWERINEKEQCFPNSTCCRIM